MDNGVSLCVEHHTEIHEGKDKLILKIYIIAKMVGIGTFHDMDRDAQARIHMGGAEHLESFINEHK